MDSDGFPDALSASNQQYRQISIYQILLLFVVHHKLVKPSTISTTSKNWIFMSIIIMFNVIIQVKLKLNIVKLFTFSGYLWLPTNSCYWYPVLCVNTIATLDLSTFLSLIFTVRWKFFLTSELLNMPDTTFDANSALFWIIIFNKSVMRQKNS